MASLLVAINPAPVREKGKDSKLAGRVSEGGKATGQFLKVFLILNNGLFDSFYFLRSVSKKRTVHCLF